MGGKSSKATEELNQNTSSSESKVNAGRTCRAPAAIDRPHAGHLSPNAKEVLAMSTQQFRRSRGQLHKLPDMVLMVVLQMCSPWDAMNLGACSRSLLHLSTHPRIDFYWVHTIHSSMWWSAELSRRARERWLEGSCCPKYAVMKRYSSVAESHARLEQKIHVIQSEETRLKEEMKAKISTARSQVSMVLLVLLLLAHAVLQSCSLGVDTWMRPVYFAPYRLLRWVTHGWGQPGGISCLLDGKEVFKFASVEARAAWEFEHVDTFTQWNSCFSDDGHAFVRWAVSAALLCAYCATWLFYLGSLVVVMIYAMKVSLDWVRQKSSEWCRRYPWLAPYSEDHIRDVVYMPKLQKLKRQRVLLHQVLLGRTPEETKQESNCVVS